MLIYDLLIRSQNSSFHLPPLMLEDARLAARTGSDVLYKDAGQFVTV
jgi:hypothetical protein